MSKHQSYRGLELNDDIPGLTSQLYRYFRTFLAALRHPDVPEFVDGLLEKELVLLAKHLSRRLVISNRLHQKENPDVRAVDRGERDARAAEEAKDFFEEWEVDNLEP